MSDAATKALSVASLVLVLIGAAVFAVVQTRVDQAPDDQAPDVEPVSVTAAGPRFATLDDLTAASDAIVFGTITAVEPGRALTDPANPDAGIQTQLNVLSVERLLSSGDSAAIVGSEAIVEQESALLDGTPLIVNGLAAFEQGDEGVFFLIAGGTEEFPYLALVNEQGYVAVDDGYLTPTSSELWMQFDGIGLEALATRLVEGQS